MDLICGIDHLIRVKSSIAVSRLESLVIFPSRFLRASTTLIIPGTVSDNIVMSRSTKRGPELSKRIKNVIDQVELGDIAQDFPKS